MYILIHENEIKAYPYDVKMLMRENPQISFPKNMSDELLSTWNIYPITKTNSPSVDHNKDVVEGLPTLIDGKWVQNWIVSGASDDEIKKRNDSKSIEVRNTRNKKLSETDWAGLSDNRMSVEMTTYRQQLRDITLQSGFPNKIDWPTLKPSTTYLTEKIEILAEKTSSSSTAYANSEYSISRSSRSD